HRNRHSFPTRRSSDLFSQMTEAEGAVVPLLIKSDVHGSTEALRDALTKLSNDEVKVKVISSGVGGITESDATLAAASNAVIIGLDRKSTRLNSSHVKI